MSVETSPAALDIAGSPHAVRVALVAEKDTYRDHLRELLRSDGIECAVEVDFISQLTRDAVIDTLVLGIRGTRAQCLEGFKAARSRFPDTPIVGLWPDDAQRENQRALKAGIDALLPESQTEAALALAVTAVCSGLVCFPRRTPSADRAATLSSREKQVLAMLILGFTNAEIGRRLYLAESTVKSHVSSAYMKLGVRSRKDAAALILDPHVGLGTEILAISNP